MAADVHLEGDEAVGGSPSVRVRGARAGPRGLVAALLDETMGLASRLACASLHGRLQIHYRSPPAGVPLSTRRLTRQEGASSR